MKQKTADFKEGQKVLYKPFPGCDRALWEFGVVTSINDKFVFVQYNGDTQSKATRPEDLE